MPKLERVLILSASYGEGHQQAALAVQDALLAEYPDIDVKIIDYLHTVHPMLNSFARYCYLKSVRFAPALYGLFYKGTSRITPRSLIQKRLNHLGLEDLADYLHVYQPTIVLSTFPTPAGVMSLLKQRGLTDVPGATVITDHAIHSQWIHPFTDHYFVGSNHVKQGLILRGVTESRITVTGIPIRSVFFQPVDKAVMRKKLGLEVDVPTLLVMGGAYGVLGDITQICEELFASPKRIQVLVVCGRNQRMRAQVEQIARDAENPVWVYGFTREVHELMGAADLVITKAGGLTISEALAMELPMLLYRPIPGQETQNAAFLVKSRVAVLARTRKQVIQHVQRLFSDDQSRLRRMQASTRMIRKLTAAHDIARGLANVEGLVSAEEQLAVSEHLYAKQS